MSVSEKWTRIVVVALLAMGGAAALTGCEEPPNHVQVEITSESLDMGVDLDSLVLTITASHSATGYELCEPYSVSYSLVSGEASSIDLPYTLEIAPGAYYDQVVLMRVVGKLGSQVRFRTERAASLGAGPVVIPVALSTGCLDVGLEPGEHCLDGVGMESPFGRIFDEGLNVQPGADCRVEE